MPHKVRFERLGGRLRFVMYFANTRGKLGFEIFTRCSSMCCSIKKFFFLFN